jgi:bifunctional DNase/RNase
MIEAVVESISAHLLSNHRVVILKEVDGDRQLPIWIGEFEAEAITRELRQEETPRPFPYHLLRSAIESLGGVVESVAVAELTQDVFHGRVVINQNGRTIELDSRASDAIALALRCNCPIFVDERVMDVAGIRPGETTDEESEGSFTAGASQRAESGHGGDDRLNIFRDFIDTLDLDDFGRQR